MNWRLVGAKVIMKDKREMDVETEAEAGRRNGSRVFGGGRMHRPHYGSRWPLLAPFFNPVSTAVTEVLGHRHPHWSSALTEDGAQWVWES